jgi:hypothetical protein
LTQSAPLVRLLHPALSRSTLHWPRDSCSTTPPLSSAPLVSLVWLFSSFIVSTSPYFARIPPSIPHYASRGPHARAGQAMNNVVSVAEILSSSGSVRAFLLLRFGLAFAYHPPEFAPFSNIACANGISRLHQHCC